MQNRHHLSGINKKLVETQSPKLKNVTYQLGQKGCLVQKFLARNNVNSFSNWRPIFVEPYHEVVAQVIDIGVNGPAVSAAVSGRNAFKIAKQPT